MAEWREEKERKEREVPYRGKLSWINIFKNHIL